METYQRRLGAIRNSTNFIWRTGSTDCYNSDKIYLNHSKAQWANRNFTHAQFFWVRRSSSTLLHSLGANLLTVEALLQFIELARPWETRSTFHKSVIVSLKVGENHWAKYHHIWQWGIPDYIHYQFFPNYFLQGSVSSLIRIPDSFPSGPFLMHAVVRLIGH